MAPPLFAAYPQQQQPCQPLASQGCPPQQSYSPRQGQQYQPQLLESLSEAPRSKELGPKPSASVPAPEKMKEIIRKQKASGSWDWSDAAALVGITPDKLRKAIPADKLQTGTPHTHTHTHMQMTF